MRRNLTHILAAASVAALVGAIPASVVKADTPVTSPRLTELESDWIAIRAESEELGGNPNPASAIRAVRGGMHAREAEIARFERIATDFGATAAAIDEIKREVGDASIFGVGDAARQGGQQVAVEGIKWGCTKIGAKAAAGPVGWIFAVGDVIEYGGKIIIREINENDIRDQLRHARLQLSNIYDVLRKLRADQSADRATVRQLEELKARENQLFDQIATERRRLQDQARRAADRPGAGRATRHAVDNRATDPEGDREEARKYLEERIRVINPEPRRQGVGPAQPRQGAMSLSPFARDVLAAHNGERARYGYPDLRWNPALEVSASAYANQLASTGRRVHASRAGRGIERENLSQGMLGWNSKQMMASWIAERQHFTPGTFPNVCAGDWSKCGHYTQMIWPTTTDIGCGMARGSGFNWLVCRYSPGGNKDGKLVGVPVPVDARAAGRRVC
ncbi:MAG TPA: CAP domain-containing protein [Sphingomicrobium sp.]|nr:CAP domain-containing protein [Sphingomicrobium sp.]